MNFWLKILNHLMFAGTMFFAAGAIAEPGGADGAIVVDSPTEVPESTAGPDDPSPDETVEGDTKPEQAEKPEGEEQKVDGRTVPSDIRKLMDGLKTENPKLHTQLKDILFRDRAIREVVPGGIQEIKQMKEAFSALGEGPVDQVIQNVKEELSEGRALDELFEKGDPKLFEKMIEFSPDGFKKLLPAAVSKYSQVDPEGYQRTMAGILHNTLQGANVINTLAFVNRLLAKGDTAGAIEELKGITEWTNSIGELAKSKPAAPNVDQAAQDRDKELGTREFNLWQQETATPINKAKTDAIKAELKQYAKDQTIDDETYEALEAQCLRYVNDLLKADPNFAPTFSKYVDNRDREGVTKYMQSKLKELLPSKPGKMGPVERAYKLFFKGAKPAAKPGQKAPVQPARAVPKGWEKVAKAPEPHEIDRKATPFEMIFQNQAAVLANGKKVFWGQNAPA